LVHQGCLPSWEVMCVRHNLLLLSLSFPAQQELAKVSSCCPVSCSSMAIGHHLYLGVPYVDMA
jgi:hypothetical protein